MRLLKYLLTFLSGLTIGIVFMFITMVEIDIIQLRQKIFLELARIELLEGGSHPTVDDYRLSLQIYVWEMENQLQSVFALPCESDTRKILKRTEKYLKKVPECH